MDSKESIGKRIRHIRKEMQKSQEEFAEFIEVTPETVSNLERGLVYPSLRTLINIRERCGKSINYLLNLDDKLDNDED